MTPAPRRTLVAAGEARVRQIVTWLFDQDPRFEVVGSVGTGDEAAGWPGPIDAALVDLTLPGLDAFQTVRALRTGHPDITLLVVATVEGPYFRAAAQASGADGYADRSANGANPAELLADLCFGTGKT